MARPDSVVGQQLTAMNKQTIAGGAVLSHQYLSDSQPRFTPNDLPKGGTYSQNIIDEAAAGKATPWQNLSKDQLNTMGANALRQAWYNRIGIDTTSPSKYPDGQTAADANRWRSAGHLNAGDLKKFGRDMELQQFMDEGTTDTNGRWMHPAKTRVL
jgi:hypothetical protein